MRLLYTEEGKMLMVPQNESATIILACQELDELLKRKYMIFGASFTAFLFLMGIAVSSLFLNENWFLFLFVLPFLSWQIAEHYLKSIGQKINHNIEIIKLHHQHEILRNAAQYKDLIANNAQYYYK
jgi:positive regulator of sigma E activity